MGERIPHGSQLVRACQGRFETEGLTDRPCPPPSLTFQMPWHSVAPASWAAVKQVSMKGKKEVGLVAAYPFWVFFHRLIPRTTFERKNFHLHFAIREQRPTSTQLVITDPIFRPSPTWAEGHGPLPARGLHRLLEETVAVWWIPYHL